MKTHQKKLEKLSPTTKKQILVYWYYQRPDLLLLFTQLSEIFDFHFILYKNQSEDSVTDFPFARYYWGDFKTPYQLISQIQPSAIIFLELSNIYAIALNIAAKFKKIPTFILEHGIKLDFEYYAQIGNSSSVEQPLKSSSIPKSGRIAKIRSKINSIIFYFGALKLQYYTYLHSMVVFLRRFSASHSDGDFPSMSFALSRADFYILFSPQNLNYYQVRDKITEESVIYIGNPYLKPYVDDSQTAKEKNFLLLDDGRIDVNGISFVQKNTFLSKLNAYAISQNAKLHVKLHPADYDQKGLLNDINITYYKNCNIDSLISEASLIFGMSSTLILPLIAIGKVVPFSLPLSPLQDVLREYGVKFLDYCNFEIKDLELFASCLVSELRQAFIDRFLYKLDGEAAKRLRQALLSQIIENEEATSSIK